MNEKSSILPPIALIPMTQSEGLWRALGPELLFPYVSPSVRITVSGSATAIQVERRASGYRDAEYDSLYLNSPGGAQLKYNFLSVNSR